jgi:hypothetical protein
LEGTKSIQLNQLYKPKHASEKERITKQGKNLHLMNIKVKGPLNSHHNHLTKKKIGAASNTPSQDRPFGLGYGNNNEINNQGNCNVA